MCVGNIYVNELYGHDVGRIQAQLMHELAMPDVFQVSLMSVCLRLKAGCFIWISSVFRKKVFCWSMHHMCAAYVLYARIQYFGVCSIFLLFVGCRLWQHVEPVSLSVFVTVMPVHVCACGGGQTCVWLTGIYQVSASEWITPSILRHSLRLSLSWCWRQVVISWSDIFISSKYPIAHIQLSNHRNGPQRCHFTPQPPQTRRAHVPVTY